MTTGVVTPRGIPRDVESEGAARKTFLRDVSVNDFRWAVEPMFSHRFFVRNPRAGSHDRDLPPAA